MPHWFEHYYDKDYSSSVSLYKADDGLQLRIQDTSSHSSSVNIEGRGNGSEYIGEITHQDGALDKFHIFMCRFVKEIERNAYQKAKRDMIEMLEKGKKSLKLLAWFIAVVVGSCVGTSVIFAIQNRDLPCLLLAFGFASYVIGNFLVEDVLHDE